MKKLYLLIAIFYQSFIHGQNFHDTQGKLDISTSGQAAYTLPIAMPPSLKDVGPIINLTYSSGQLAGIAGQGWSISSVSNICRMATRKDIDGYVDGVDFDDNDKLALDGQRLILKSGTYWADGSTYATEVQSNTKIELKGSGTSIYFIVTTPDGSRSWYGNYGGLAAIDNTSFYIVRFEDANGNYITYDYKYPIGNTMVLSEILFSANTNGLTPLNSIKFNYKAAKRTESVFLKGSEYKKSALLDYIEVKTNGQLFRKYQLTHILDSQLGYEKIGQIQESNGAGELANPIIFEYKMTQNLGIGSEKKTTYINNLSFNNIRLSGDFDGDGRLDFTTDTQLFTNLFQGSGAQTPITSPFTISERQTFTATTLNNNKLNQFQSIINAVETASAINFNVYNLTGNILMQSYSKNIELNNRGTNLGCLIGTYQKYNNIYYEGDYNGDGISEVLIISSNNEIKNNTIRTFGHETECYGIPTDSGLDYSIVDLNPNSSTTLNETNGYIKVSNTSIIGDLFLNVNAKSRYVADFNSDGKSDILIVNSDKNYKIISFKQLTTAPWTEVEILGQGTIDAYSTTKQILFGDYNGDGKTDIMLPANEGGLGQATWYIYYSNPNPAGGSFFVKETHNIVEYWPNTGTYYNTQTQISNYYALDTNGDGKSDLVRVWRKHYKPSLTINDHNTQWVVTTFANNIGNSNVIGNKFTLDYTSPCLSLPLGLQNCNHDNDSPDIPVPIVSNYKYQGANNEIVMVRNHHNELTYIDLAKDVSQDVLLTKVTTSGGNIVDEISYKSMEPSLLNNGQGDMSEFYSSNNSVDYPNIEIKRLVNNNLVFQLKNTTEGVIKLQDFRYNSFVVNMNGLGAIGFNKTARSTWYQNPASKRIWSVTENNPLQRGATQRSYTQLATTGSTFSFVASGNPTGIINSTTNVFVTNTSNSIYSLLLSSQTVTDYITNVATVTTNTYDSTYLLPSTATTQNLLSGVVQGTNTVTNEFDNNPTGIGSAYYIGRPKKSTSVASAYGDTFSTEQKYTYTNNNLSRLEKKGNTINTIYLTEDYEYDGYGNIKKKTLSMPDAIPAVVPRITEYTYDPTGRFVKTAKDIEGLVSTNNIYHPLYGLVTSATNPFGLTTTSTYDNWGKPTKITDFLGKSIYYSYSKSANEYTTTKTGDDGSSSIAISDALGRPKKSGTKNIDDTWSYKNVEYDFLGRQYRESEPYNSGNPTLWSNTSTYDDYNRIITTVAATGLTTIVTYNGLTVTGNDGTKTTSSTKNANGHVIAATDNGGAINYTYYANGNLKTSNYLGTIISMEYNEWGAKTKLTDPSAGMYTYKYNPLGETIEETTPNGTTTYTLNDVGKLTKKTISGTNTNSETTYTYDNLTKLPTTTSFKDILNSNAITSYTYEYDASKRLFKTTEVTPYASFIKQLAFDSFGRIDTETPTATVLASGKASAKTIQYTYKNGYLWQIKNQATSGIIWQTNTVNARGQLTSAIQGKETITNTYNLYGYQTQARHDWSFNGASGNVMILNTVFDSQKGNLTSRTNSMFGTSDNFTYDSLDRLTSYPNALGIIETQTYDNRGRITQNAVGTYNYTNTAKAYQNTSVTITAEVLPYYQARPTQNITYNTFKSPVEIEEVGIDKISFTYNDGNDRSSMFYGGVQADKLQRRYRKYYSADGSMEIKEDKTLGTVDFITYIGGDGYTAPIILKSNGTTQNYLYLHRDYQGSILAITNDTGQTVEKRLFDAWGNIALVQDGLGNNLGALTLIDRGYTGHEHLQSVGLINMNGRLYDPKLHRFLQPDNNIQDPYNTQNYNRYGYVLNNPLKYTDPSGEMIQIGAAILIGAVIAATTYTLRALLADVPFTVDGFLGASFIGAFSAAVTFGIGDLAGSIHQLGSRMVFQALAHGSFNGMMSGLQGGKFWSGFAAGSLSSLAAGLWQGGAMENGGNWSGAGGSWGSGDFGTIAFGTVSGGAGSALTGGNFWQGAVTGLTVSLLNDVAHKQTINEFAKKKFGADYRKKYGVKSLRWGSQLPKEGLKSSDGDIYTYNHKTRYINSSSGGVIGGLQGKGIIYISNAYRYISNTLYLEATLGHELIHSYHEMKFGADFRTSFSEFSAYQYSIDFYINNNLNANELSGNKYMQSTYTLNPAYDYKKIPGF